MVPTAWEAAHKDACTVRYFYLEHNGDDFSRSFYIKIKGKEENEVESKPRVRALMLKVSTTLELDEKLEADNAVVLGEELTGGTDGDCKGKNCIRLGAESKLIQEINIRLAGFGGNVPTKKFTPRTVTMIKQFQKDYMEIEPTGNICGDTLKAIDEFSEKFDVSSTVWGQLDCSCTGKGTKKHNKLNNKEEQNNCNGWGDKSGKNTYKSSIHTEAMHKYEYPGIHRSLLFGLKTLLFYMSKQSDYEFGHISSGYRCRFKQYKTTNHQGKAIDIQFNKGSWKIRGKQNKNLAELKEIKKIIFTKKFNAKTNWTNVNHFSLEPIGMSNGNTWSWIHMDVRKFNSDFLKDEFFCKDKSSLNGRKIVNIAKEEGFTKTCDCLGGYTSQQRANNSASNSEYKWAHSKFGNLIAEKESRNDYNLCNKTKIVNGKRKVFEVTDVKIIETSIKDIQEKQKKKELFAVGRYQVIPVTLNSAISFLSLDVNKKLDEEMQDKIFDEYLIDKKRPKIISFLEGNGNVNDAMYAAAKEWASIGVEKGKTISKGRIASGGETYYAGDGLNKAHITPEQIKNVLINSKNESQ
ncbi:peptidoglycan-binding protein [Tenacibaculum finnmarkense]|nr:peptidoglycan-binding domain-containing protein [Tenacibaculum finnmarkense]MCG8210912.1 hypothetical protein [Tenacibaculum finnmarkense genomovar finnmarkense]MCG8247621.1 hypothetical protein [Tenacibaculum finnmarkense genomovar finnmarkense]MCG8889114.1 peptidoglycan-binding protein [Tenacibaculum finnmarkense]